MRSQYDLTAELRLDVGLQFVEVDRTLCSSHGRFDTRAQVDRLDRSIQVLGHFDEKPPLGFGMDRSNPFRREPHQEGST